MSTDEFLSSPIIVNQVVNNRNSPIDIDRPSVEMNQTALLVKLVAIESVMFHCHKGLLMTKKSSVKRNSSTFQDAILKPSKGLKSDVELICKFIKTVNLRRTVEA